MHLYSDIQSSSKAHSLSDLPALGHLVGPPRRRCTSDNLPFGTLNLKSRPSYHVSPAAQDPDQGDSHAQDAMPDGRDRADDSTGGDLDVSGLPIGGCPRPLDSGLARILGSSSVASELSGCSSDVFGGPIPRRLPWVLSSSSRVSGFDDPMSEHYLVGESSSPLHSPLRSTPHPGDFSGSPWNTSRERTRQFTFGVAPSWNGESTQDIFSSSPLRASHSPSRNFLPSENLAQHIDADDASSDVEFEPISELEASREIYDMFHLGGASFAECAADSSMLERERSFRQSFMHLDDADDDDASSDASAPVDTREILQQLFHDAEATSDISRLGARHRTNSIFSEREDAASLVLSAMPSSASFYPGPAPWLHDREDVAAIDEGFSTCVGAVAGSVGDNCEDPLNSDAVATQDAAKQCEVVALDRHGPAEAGPSIYNDNTAPTSAHCTGHDVGQLSLQALAANGESDLGNTIGDLGSLHQATTDELACDSDALQTPRRARRTPPATVSELDEDLQFILACRVIASRSTIPPPIPPKHPARLRSGTLGRTSAAPPPAQETSTAPQRRPCLNYWPTHNADPIAARRAWSATVPHPSHERDGINGLFIGEARDVDRGRAVSEPVGKDGRPLRPLPSRCMRYAATVGPASSMNQPESAPWTVDEHITLVLLQQSVQDSQHRASVRSSTGPGGGHLPRTSRSRMGPSLRSRSIASPAPQGRVSSFVEETITRDVLPMQACMCGLVSGSDGCGTLVQGRVYKTRKSLRWGRFWNTITMYRLRA